MTSFHGPLIKKDTEAQLHQGDSDRKEDEPPHALREAGVGYETDSVNEVIHVPWARESRDQRWQGRGAHRSCLTIQVLGNVNRLLVGQESTARKRHIGFRKCGEGREAICKDCTCILVVLTPKA